MWTPKINIVGGNQSPHDFKWKFYHELILKMALIRAISMWISQLKHNYKRKYHHKLILWSQLKQTDSQTNLELGGRPNIKEKENKRGPRW